MYIMYVSYYTSTEYQYCIVHICMYMYKNIPAK